MYILPCVKLCSLLHDHHAMMVFFAATKYFVHITMPGCHGVSARANN